MKEVISLIGFEYKKLFIKKITWITLGAVLAIILFSGGVALWGNIEAGGKVVSSNYEDEMAQKKEELSYSGELIDENLLLEAQRSYQNASLEYTSSSYGNQDDWNQYKVYIRPYISLSGLVTMAGLDIYTGDMSDFYESRKAAMEKIYVAEDLSKEEMDYHFALDEAVEKPFVFNYTKAYYRFFALQYSNGLFILFAVAICTAGIFAGEYTSKVDALMLSAKYGKNRVIIAKLLTGFSFAVAVSLLFSLSSFLEMGLAYGFDGGNVPIQVKFPLLSTPVTMLQAAGLMLLFGVLAACFMAAVTMLCSAKMKTNFSVIILSSVLIFVTLFLKVPYQYHSLYLLINLLPGNIISFSGIFSDQLLQIGDKYFGAYQYTPVVYAGALAIFSWLAFRGFKRHQIG